MSVVGIGYIVLNIVISEVGVELTYACISEVGVELAYACISEVGVVSTPQFL